MTTIDFVATFITFFAVIDPVGTVPIFVAVTAQHSAKAKRRIALIATAASAGILMFFLIAGEIILTAMSIPLTAFKVAGGIVLFLFALSMIFGDSKPEQELKLTKNCSDTAIYPLAVPSIAGPGSMLAVVLATENARFSVWEQAQTGLTMLSVLVIVYLFMLLAGWIQKLIGDSGASIVSRVMGLILASIATANTLEGVKEYFSL